MTTEAPPCVHHRRIESPHGPVSNKSYCQLCGAKGRDYPNTNAYEYNNDPLFKTLIPYQQEQIWD